MWSGEVFCYIGKILIGVCRGVNRKNGFLFTFGEKLFLGFEVCCILRGKVLIGR